jgi:SAM-dependent methyltransferase
VSDHPIRQVADAVTEAPATWGSFRRGVLATFDELARDWESRLGPEQLTALSAALQQIPAPSRALDVACGTGIAADLVAGSFPSAGVTALDLSFEMLRAAVRKPRPHSVRFVTGDASALPFPDATFDLVTVLNGLIFANELARVLTPSGVLAVAFSSGADTPIYVDPGKLEGALIDGGFIDVRSGRAGPGNWISARKPESIRR